MKDSIWNYDCCVFISDFDTLNWTIFNNVPISVLRYSQNLNVHNEGAVLSHFPNVCIISGKISSNGKQISFTRLQGTALLRIIGIKF